MTSSASIAARALTLTVLLGLCGVMQGAERVTLRNGFGLDCTREEAAGDRVRLYLAPSASGSSVGMAENYIEVNAAEIAGTEPLQTVPADPKAGTSLVAETGVGAQPTAAEMQGMLSRAGERHNVDADLLASVIRAESAWRTHAVSRAGAQGLMQLMPTTAAQLGVADSFAAEQNIGGGTAYLDQLLTRYHDNIAFALAAYNAGPTAVDRYHGIPPFAETRGYVARVIREFNRRKLARAASSGSRAAAR